MHDWGKEREKDKECIQMISVSIFSTQADRLFVLCEVMEAETLFLLVFTEPYSQPVMRDHAHPTILEPVRFTILGAVYQPTFASLALDPYTLT